MQRRSVAERAEPVGNILWLNCSLQGYPGGHHLSPTKALAEARQGSSTNLDSYSTWYLTPFSTNVSCPPLGVDTIIWTLLSDQRAATSLGPAEMWRAEGKGGAQHPSAYLEHAHSAHSSRTSSGWRSAGGVTCVPQTLLFLIHRVSYLGRQLQVSLPRTGQLAFPSIRKHSKFSMEQLL